MLQGVYFRSEEKVKISGQFEKGLCVGTWDYELVLPLFCRKIIERNSYYFDINYKFEPTWSSKVLLSDPLKFSAKFQYFKGSNCLNNKCLSVVIK